MRTTLSRRVALAGALLAAAGGAAASWLGPRSPERVPEVKLDIRRGAFEALNLWSDQRTYPAAEMSGGQYFRAFERLQGEAARADREIQTTPPWKLLGPTNRGGRTIALAVDPRDSNVVYAGGAAGGLWRLTVRGNGYGWEYIDTKFPVLGVNAIAVDPRDSQVIYIGTGEVYGYGKSIGGIYIRNTRGSYGIGLLKSTDRGGTWKKSIDWSLSQQRGVQVIRIHPTDSNVVFAGTSEGVFRSRDAGATWEQVHPVVMTVDMAINPIQPDTIYVSSGNLGTPDTGIYRSTAGGAPGSFQKLAGGLPASWRGKALLSMSQATPSTIYADVANESGTVGIFRTTDGGNSWTMVNATNIASYQGWFSHFVRVHPRDSMRVLAAGVAMHGSTDGGATFATRGGMHPDHHCFADDPQNPEVVWVGNDGGVYRSTDGGNSFQDMSNGYATAQFYNGFSSSPKDPNLAIGGLQDNRCSMFTGASTWRGFLGGDGTFTAIDPSDDNVMYAASQGLSISRSVDRGRTWTSIAGMLEGGRACFVAPFVLAPSQPSTLYGGKDLVFKTTDRGDSWQRMNGGNPLNGNPVVAIGVAPQDANLVYAATVPGGGRRAEIFASTDGAQTFKSVTGTLPDRYYIDVVVSPHDKQVVYATLSGFGSSHLFRSENGGGAWNDVGRGLPDVPTSAVAIDPANHRTIYVGNDLGVFVSVDYGQTWAQWKDGMPTAALVMDLSLSISNRRIRAVTHGNGVYERDMLPVEAAPPGPPLPPADGGGVVPVADAGGPPPVRMDAGGAGTRVDGAGIAGPGAEAGAPPPPPVATADGAVAPPPGPKRGGTAGCRCDLATDARTGSWAAVALAALAMVLVSRGARRARCRRRGRCPQLVGSRRDA